LTSQVITSRQNPLIQDLRDRNDPAVAKGLFLEGLHLLEEALKAGMPIHHLVVVPALAEMDLVRRAMSKAKRTTQVSAYVMKALSEVESPQGVIAICARPQWDWSVLVSHPPSPLVILDGIQDPGNVAAILRTAEDSGSGRRLGCCDDSGDGAPFFAQGPSWSHGFHFADSLS
jgi:TrmH family RNA methyltransferase